MSGTAATKSAALALGCSLVASSSLLAIVLLMRECGRRRKKAEEETLEEIGRRYNLTTDKTRTKDSYVGGDKVDKGFCRQYETMLEPYRMKPNIRFLELGVYYGKSLAMWADWFYHPTSTVYGVDIHLDRFWQHRPALEAMGAFQQQQQHRHCATVKVYEFDTYSDEFRAWICHQQQPMDIVLDDGNHTAKSQWHVFAMIFPLLAPGGLYIIEDIDQPWDFFLGGGCVDFDIDSSKTIFGGFPVVLAAVANPDFLHSKVTKKKWIQKMKEEVHRELYKAEKHLEKSRNRLSQKQQKQQQETTTDDPQEENLREHVRQKEKELLSMQSDAANRERRFSETYDEQRRIIQNLVKFVDRVEVREQTVVFYKNNNNNNDNNN